MHEKPSGAERMDDYVWDVGVPSSVKKTLDSIMIDHIKMDEQSDIPAPTDFLDDLHQRTGLLPPISLDRIASITLGLSSSGHLSSDSYHTSDPSFSVESLPAICSEFIGSV